MKGILLLGCCLLLPVFAQADPGFNWAAIYDGGGNYDDSGLFVTSDPAGNTVVAGLSHDGIEGLDIIVRKLDRVTGAEIWAERIPAFDESDMMISGMEWGPDGNLVVAGHLCGCVG